MEWTDWPSCKSTCTSTRRPTGDVESIWRALGRTNLLRRSYHIPSYGRTTTPSPHSTAEASIKRLRTRTDHHCCCDAQDEGKTRHFQKKFKWFKRFIARVLSSSFSKAKMAIYTKSPLSMKRRKSNHWKSNILILYLLHLACVFWNLVSFLLQVNLVISTCSFRLSETLQPTFSLVSSTNSRSWGMTTTNLSSVPHHILH